MKNATSSSTEESAQPPLDLPTQPTNGGHLEFGIGFDPFDSQIINLDIEKDLRRACSGGGAQTPGRVMQHLKGAGQWVLGVAESIGGVRGGGRH